MKKLALISQCLFLSLLAWNARAAVVTNWWDNNKLSAATSGTWDNTSTNWSTTSSLNASTVAFTNGNIAFFAAGTTGISALTITVNSAVSCAGMGSGVSGAAVTNVTISGTGSIGLASGSDGIFCSPGNFTINVPVTGSGELVQHGTGFILLNASNSYSGGTGVTGGQIIYYTTNASFGTGPIMVTATGNALVNDTSPAAALVITNAFSFSAAGFAINLAGGNPVSGAPGTTFTGPFVLPLGTTTINASSSATQVTEISGVISGSGANLTVADDGTLELGGVNSYSGGTTISSPAILSIVGSGSLGGGSYAGAITNGSTFIYNSSAAQALSGVISGTGTLTESLGTLTLTASNTYSGNTTINGGTLALSGTGSVNTTPVISIAAGGTFDVSGLASAYTLSSTTTLNASGTATPATINGASGGTISLGSQPVHFTYDGTDIPLTVSFSGGSGTLVLGGNTISVNTAIALGANTYTLVQVTGGGTISSGLSGAVDITGAGLASGCSASLQASGGHLNLVVVGPGQTETWNGNDFNNSPNWSDGANWASATPPDLTGDSVFFGGTQGLSPVMNNSYTVDSLTFNSGAGAFVLGNSGGSVLGVVYGVTNNSTSLQTLNLPVQLYDEPVPWNLNNGSITINGVVSDGGNGMIVSGGGGTLTLSGANTYTGGTTVTNGATVMANTIADSPSSIGPSGAFTLAGGTLDYSGSGGSTVRQFNGVTGTTSSIDLNGNLTLAGRVTGTGAFTVVVNQNNPSGVLTLQNPGDNSFLGMIMNGGTVVLDTLAAGHSLGTASSIGANTTLRLGGTGGADIYSGVVITNNNGGLFDANGQNDTFNTLILSGTGISGSGALINSSTNASTLTVASKLTGDTTIGGSSSVGNLTLIGVISGDYALTYAGGGMLTLTGTNTFNGGLNINPGQTVQVNSGAATTSAAAGTGPVNIGANGNLNISIAVNNGVFPNPINGPSNATVNIVETAADNLQINSDMSGFTGSMNCPTTPGTTAKAQILSPVFSINPNATINVANGGTLYIADPSVTVPCTINLYGTGNTESYGALRIESNAVISGPVILLGNTTMGNSKAGIAIAPTISGAISGAFGITYTAQTGTIILAGANTYSGSTTLSGNILQLDSVENPGVSGPLGEPATPAGSLICKGGALQFTGLNHFDYSGRFSSNSTAYAFDENGQTVTLASPLTGAATLTNISSIAGGVLVLSAANTYSGTTGLGSGTVQLAGADTPGTSGPLGSATVAGSIVLGGGTLQYTAANGAHDYSSRFSTAASQNYNVDVKGQNVTFATALTSSSGQITLSSTTSGGTLTLSGTNTYTGATTINPGATLAISGSGSLATSYNGAITDNGTLNYASSANQTLRGVIFGEGSVVQSGAGTLTLSNANTYFGGTLVNAGILDINTTGSIQGNATVNAGVLELDNASALASGATLTLASSPSAGAVNLNFSGMQTVSALFFGSTPMPPGTYGAVGNGSVTYQNAAFIGTGILNVGGEGVYWDPRFSLAFPGSGGNGSWDLSTADWFNGTADAAWTNGNIATFAGTPGTVTLGAGLTVNALTFATNNYSIVGGNTLTLSGTTAASTPIVNIPAGNTIISSSITTSVTTNNLIINGPGTLTLTGANPFTNPILITGGATLSVNSISDTGISALGNLGSVSNLTLLEGNLSFTGSSGQMSRSVTVQGTTTDVLNVPAGDSLEIDGQIHVVSSTAPQSLTFSGGGTLIMGGSVDNSSLTMAINAGTVQINKTSISTVHGLGGGTSTVASNATLQLAGSGGFDLYSGCILVDANGSVFDLNGQSDTFSSLTVSGTGINNSGALINSSSVPSTISPTITLAGPTTIGGSGSFGPITLTGVISGSGMPLTCAGSGGLILSGANTYSGGLNLTANTTVTLSNAAAGGTGTIDIGSGSTLILPTATTFANPISGSGTIQVNLPAGNTFITGSLSSFTGTVNCETATTSGQLVMNNINSEAYPINAAATWNIANGATLDLATPFTNDPASVVIGGVGNNQAFGALRLDACNQSGNVSLNSQLCLIGDGNTTGPSTISGIISDNGAGYGFALVGSGSGANGPYTMILAGTNTYAGPTIVSNNNTLAIGATGSIAGSSSISLDNGTTFDVSRVSGGYALGANQTLANFSGSAKIVGSLNLSSGMPLNLTNDVSAAPLILSGGTMTMNNNPVSISIADSIVPTSSGYLLISGTNGGSVVGNVSSSPVTINGLPSNPGGPSLSIINGSLYLVAGPPDIMVGPVPLNPVIFASPSNKITFSAIVFGANPLTNQWYTNGTSIPGATNTSVTLTGMPVGTYTVTFGSTNSFSPPASGSTLLTVVASPTNAFPESVLSNNPIGYWRLNELDNGPSDPNNGQICHDFITGNDGIYTNTSLGNPGYNSVDSALPSYDPETSADFGSINTPNSCAYNIPNIDVSAPTNKSATFSVMAWVQCPNTISDSINTPGIVGKGIYNEEEFTIDCGNHIGTVDAYRFSVRNAAGTVFSASSTLIAGSDTNWHFLVGVCDQVHSNVSFYIDGTNAATVVMPAGSGIVGTSAAFPMSIGARSSVGTSYDQQFSGFINDVAVFSNALSGNQIQGMYFQAGIAPTVSLETNEITVNEFGTATDVATVYGSPALGLQWYFTDTTNNVYIAPGQTNTTLNLTNVQPFYQTVFVVVTNAYGSVTSAPVLLSINTGPAYVQVQASPSIVDVPPGTTLSYSVVAYGTDPISYEWLLNGSTVIPGATNSTLTLIAQLGTNTYTPAVSNSQNNAGWNLGNPVTVVAANTPPVIGLDNGSGWSLQSGAGPFSPTISSGILEITSAAASEANSAFYMTPQYISNGFIASFTYTPSGGTTTRADGTAFVLQNAPAGYQAVGGGGGGLGVKTLFPCMNFNLDLFSGSSGGTGINFGTNGATAGSPAPNGATGSVNINSLDPINVEITYTPSNNNVQVVLTDASHPTETYTTNYPVANLASVLGGVTAYVGFTGGTGSDDAEQQISDFSFVYTAPQSGPVVLNDITPTNIDAPVGAVITYSVGAFGTPPLSYYWYENGIVIGGATNSSYAFLATAGSNNFQCVVSNAVGGNATVSSSVASVTAAVTPPVVGFGNSSLWQWQGTVASLSGGVLTLTTGAPDQAGSGFYTIPQYINNGFVASFTYTPSNGGTSTRADGTTFVLQNSFDGPFALGSDGNGLGVEGITPSVDFCLDLYSGTSGGTGINWGTNGATGGVGGRPNGGTAPVNINSLDPIAVTISYHPETGLIQVVLQDTLTSQIFSTNYVVGGNLAGLVGGDSAYVGFTGGTGTDDSGQQVSNFAFTYTGPAAAIIQDLTPLNSTNFVGATNTYSVVASGDQPISYAWFVNSNLVSGATSPSFALVVPGLGTNTVQCGVSNSYNATYALSSVAMVVGTVPNHPAMSFHTAGGNLVISWSAGANLFSAPTVYGPWTIVTNATSPYTNSPSLNQEFFRAGTPY